MRIADMIRQVAAALVVAGCAGTGAQDLPRTSALPPGFVPIADGGNARPGRLYFSGEGRRPAFSLADGTRFNALCYADFEQDAILRAIDDFLGPPSLLFDRRVVETQAGAALELAPGVALAGLQLPQGSVSSGATIVLRDATRTDLTAAGEDLVAAAIGANCRNEIARLRGARQVILVTGAVSVASLEIAGATGAQVAAGGGALGVGGAVTAGNSSSETRSNVVLAVHTVPFDPAIPAQ